MGVGRELARSRPVRLGRVLVQEIIEDDLTGTAAEMAYRFLFALFPLLLFTAAVFGAIGGPAGRQDLVVELIARIRPFLPEQVALNLSGFVARLATEHSITYLTIGLLGTLWGASGGVGALLKGLNRAYDVTDARPTVRRWLFALAATALLPPLGVILLLVAVVGHSLAGGFGAALGIAADLGRVFAVAQAVATFAVSFGVMAIVYLVLPAIRQQPRDVLPGALMATILWSVLTQGFGLYVADLSAYQLTYGSFAGAIAFLLWLYLASLVVLLGAEVNALLSPLGRRTWTGPGDHE